jgi:sRNA-binding protein
MGNSSIIAKLCERFPVFEPRQNEPHRPLALKIREQIWHRWPDVDRDALGITLRWYTRRRMYLLSVITGGNRYNLDGNIAGEITPSEIEYAKKVLAGIDAKALKAAGEAAAKHEQREHTVVRHVKARPRRKPIKPPASALRQKPPVRHLSRSELAALAKARRIVG